MGAKPCYPTLYQINTRPWLYEIGQAVGLDRAATFDEVPDEILEEIAALGFDWVYLLGVWQTGPAGQQVAATDPGLRAGYARSLPDFGDADVVSSPFAVDAYTAHTDFGGPGALARMRNRLASLGIRLILDFVPNHTAPDHPWTHDHPEYYVHGSEADLQAQPENYARVQTGQGAAVLAHGRDPNFPGWTDTLQLNYRNAGLRQAQTGELLSVAGQCDGVRCDMAMLLLPDVIARTWGDRSRPVDGTPPVDVSWWPEAIAAVKDEHPDFVFMAEAYWDLEWELQQQGFDYTYDKRLYDRLLGGETPGVNAHLRYSSAEYQAKSARFLENHDEPRAAFVFRGQKSEAAAVITYLAPGLRFFHQGQLEGYRVRTAIQLRRWPAEATDPVLNAFYMRLLSCVARPEVRGGEWTWLQCRAAWETNPTWDRFVAFMWRDPARDARMLAVVNYGPTQGQCYVTLPQDGLAGRTFRLDDQISLAVYDRGGDELARRGLYVDLPAWQYNVFEMRSI